MYIEFELFPRVNLRQFMYEVRSLQKSTLTALDVHWLPYKPSDFITRVTLSIPNEEDAAKLVSITATAIAVNETRLEVEAPEKHWRDLEPLWKRLENRIRPYLATEASKDGEPPKARARRLGIRDVEKLERWDEIENSYVPEGLTQEVMAEREERSLSTIKKDIAGMKKHPEEFPLTREAFPP